MQNRAKQDTSLTKRASGPAAEMPEMARCCLRRVSVRTIGMMLIFLPSAELTAESQEPKLCCCC